MDEENPYPPQLTENEAQQLKERNQRWVKRVVALVALLLTVSPNSQLDQPDLKIVKKFRPLP